MPSGSRRCLATQTFPCPTQDLVQAITRSFSDMRANRALTQHVVPQPPVGSRGGGGGDGGDGGGTLGQDEEAKDEVRKVCRDIGIPTEDCEFIIKAGIESVIQLAIEAADEQPTLIELHEENPSRLKMVGDADMSVAHSWLGS